MLIEICSVFVQQLAGDLHLWTLYGSRAITVNVQLLDHFLATNPNRSRKLSALFAVRKGLSALFRAAETQERAPKDAIHLLTNKNSTSASASPLLGEIAGVAPRFPRVRATVENAEEEYVAFYTREIVGSRFVLPAHVASGFNEFFALYTSQDVLNKQIIPALEKALLRAPEVVLNDLITPLVNSLPSTINLSEILTKQLLRPLLFNVKSNNPIIRGGALSAFRQLSSRSSDEQELSSAAEEILKHLRDAKAVDQRILYANMLAAIRASKATSPNILSGLSPITSKETNENVLESQARVIATHAAQILSLNDSLDSGATKLLTQGLNDKKPSTRRIWAHQVGRILWDVSDETVCQDTVVRFLESSVDKMTASWDELLKNPIPSAQNGLVDVGNVTLAILLGRRRGMRPDSFEAIAKKLNIENHVQEFGSKQFFLINPRVYTKLTTLEDLSWLVRALCGIVDFVCEAPPDAKHAWGQAVIFLTDAIHVPFRVREEAIHSLTLCYVRHRHCVGQALIQGLWSWMKSLYNEERDSAAVASKLGRKHPYAVVRAMCTPLRKDNSEREAILASQVIDLMVLCRHPFMSRISWIELCLKAGLDPQDLVIKHRDKCLEQIIQNTNVWPQMTL